MTGDGYFVTIYVLYGAASVGLTVWLARTLFRNGAVFLHDVFADKPGMADAINRLLVVGFYMLNLGYAFLLLQDERTPDAVSAVEVLVERLGTLLLSLGVIHFVNLFVFWRIRRRAQMPAAPPPVAPQWYPAPWPAPAQGWGPGWNQPQ